MASTFLIRYFDLEPVALDADWFTITEMGDAQFYIGESDLVACSRAFASIQRIDMNDGGELTYNHAMAEFERNAAPEVDEDL
jgi:hypothetical protein